MLSKLSSALTWYLAHRSEHDNAAAVRDLGALGFDVRVVDALVVWDATSKFFGHFVCSACSVRRAGVVVRKLERILLVT
jgi:hypothetical protein